MTRVHGSYNRYTEGCRCDDCKSAARDQQRKQKQRFIDWPATIPADSHGTYRGYKSYSCRCDDCKAAYREYNRAERAERKALFESVIAKRGAK